MCGCNKKKKAPPPAPATTEEMLQMMTLGLKKTIQLPVRLPEAINGSDLIIMPEGDTRTVSGAVNLYGHDAEIRRGLREQIVNRWPQAFETAVPVPS